MAGVCQNGARGLKPGVCGDVHWTRIALESRAGQIEPLASGNPNAVAFNA